MRIIPDLNDVAAMMVAILDFTMSRYSQKTEKYFNGFLDPPPKTLGKNTKFNPLAQSWSELYQIDKVREPYWISPWSNSLIILKSIS